MSAANPMTMLEAYLDNITISGDTILVIFEGFQESLEELFVTGSINIIYVIGKPTLEPARFVDNEPTEYVHYIPVTIMALLIDDIWKAEKELRDMLVLLKEGYKGVGCYFRMDNRRGRQANIKIGSRVIFRYVYPVRYDES